MTAGNKNYKIESQSLVVGMCGNFFMGTAGVVAAILSNSDAILVDGLFSLIGFFSAMIGRSVSKRADWGPDRYRPAGYAADEAIFVTFRSLSLLGLLLFALSGAAMNIYRYIMGNDPAPLVFGPMLIYFVAVGLTSLGLYMLHRYNWRRTEKSSEILLLESQAAAFDGIITAAAGIGLLSIHLLKNSFLAPIAPVGDSIIVVILCASVIGRYFKGFLNGLGELSGASASASVIKRIRQAIKGIIAVEGGKVLDVSAMKVGRRFHVAIYYNPGKALTAAEIDDLTLRLEHDVTAELKGADVVLFITEYTRQWPADLDPRYNPRPEPDTSAAK